MLPSSKIIWDSATGSFNSTGGFQQSVKYSEIVHIKSLFYGLKYSVGFQALQTQGEKFNEY